MATVPNAPEAAEPESDLAPPIEDTLISAEVSNGDHNPSPQDVVEPPAPSTPLTASIATASTKSKNKKKNKSSAVINTNSSVTPSTIVSGSVIVDSVASVTPTPVAKSVSLTPQVETRNTDVEDGYAGEWKVATAKRPKAQAPTQGMMICFYDFCLLLNTC